MKKIYTLSTLLTVVLLSVFLQGCIKDTCERVKKYTYYTPVYKTKEQVRANIKSDVPVPVQTTGKIFINGNYIFLNETNKGIHVIDNSNPSSPKNVAFITIPGNVDMAVKGNILYADIYTDLVALDISNPLNVVQTKYIEGVFPFRYWGNGFTADSTMVIADWIKRDTTVIEKCDGGANVFYNTSVLFLSSTTAMGNASSNSSTPVGMGGSMARFALAGNRLYTVSSQDLNVFNITTPQDPVYVKNVSVGNWGIETIFPFKNKLFIGSSNGMYIFSVNNPDQPFSEGQFAHVRTCDPVIADDIYAYVTLSSGTTCGGFTNQLDVLNIKAINNPVLIKSYPLTNPHGLSKDKNLLFICDGADGLKVFDASNASNISLVKNITGINTYDVIATGNKAIVVASDGLYQYDYSNIQNIHLLSKITISK